MALKYYDNFLYTIQQYKSEEIDFSEIKDSLVCAAMYDIGKQLNYDKDLYITIDAWFEFIEFCYLEEDWRELALSVCDFIENAILNEPIPLELPKNDRVLRDQGFIVKEP